MDNNYDNTPKENDSSGQLADDSNATGQYTDPNAGEQPDYSQQYPYTSQNAYNYNQQNSGYQYGQQNQNNQNQNYNQNSNYNSYQDNYNYNTGNQYNHMYEPGQDSSPMSMGDWIVTLLVAMIPCVGIIMYFVWAFSATTNVNRRNFCRAQLVIMGVVLVIYIIFIALFGSMLFRSGSFYF